jgi:hypothetical protein
VRADPVATHATEASTVTAQYETLRRAALGEPLPPDARLGLLLFLRRGMWAWTQALVVAARVQPPPTRSPASVSSSPNQRREVSQVFAAMALSSHHRSAQ